MMRVLALVLASAVSVTVQASAPTGPHDAMPMMAEPSDGAAKEASRQQMRESFGQAYAKASRPRMAVWFNRTLSDRVEEWVTPVRAKGALVNSKGEVQQLEASLQFRDPNHTVRDMPGEDWVWAFEDGFDRPLLDQGVKLVDRAMILRLTAAANGADPDKTVALKKVEVDALKGHADLMIELLIKRAPDSKSGYNYQARVVQVADGRILAVVNAPDLETSVKAGRFEATDKGYERPQAGKAVAVNDVAGQLADEVMRRLVTVWR